MIRNANILVTGGAGFIGGHVTDILSQPEFGNRITILDTNFGSQTTGNDLSLYGRPNVKLVEGSVADPASFNTIPTDIDFMVHAAGFLGINVVATQQKRTMDVNIVGTRTALDFVASHEGKKPFTVMFSTSEIYGVSAESPTEDHPAVIETNGDRWCYASSKLADEFYLRAYHQEHHVPGAIIRPFNVFGAHRYGTNAMTQLVTRAVNGDALNISGDGQQVRAWCSINDFAKGIVSVLERSPRETVEAYNLGDVRNAMPMKTLAEKIVALSGSGSEVVILDNKIEDVLFRIPNIDKARRMLGYEPISDFEKEVCAVIEWAKARVLAS